jgi:acetolactate synthase-1/2/3 large subunit
MNGAESLVRTLVAGDVNVCFTNPGTSEMHFVAALDRVDGMRCVLGLFEGVVTGAADGYYRMAGKPASTLLHLGPGLANGLANLHNAKKAHSGIVNIVGQHATYHIEYNAPLTSDIEGLARPMSAWVRTSPDSKSIAKDGAAAIAAARKPSRPDRDAYSARRHRLERSRRYRHVPEDSQRASYSPSRSTNAARVLRGGEQTLLLLTGKALTEEGLALAARISGKTGCKVMGQTYNPRMARGRGRFSIDRIPYVIEQALPILKNFRHIVLVETNDPVAFFAYPNKPSLLKPEGCEVHRMTAAGENSVAALHALADALGAKATDVKPQKLAELVKPTGALTHASIAQAIAVAIPENAIVVDESITTGRGFFPPTAGAAPHDWLQNMGGSIGFSTAGRDRRGGGVSGPQGDLHGRRRQRHVHAAIAVDAGARRPRRHHHRVRQPHLSDPAGEFDGVGAGEPGQQGARHAQPRQSRRSTGCRSRRAWACRRVSVRTAEDFSRALADSMREKGPRLIEVVM